MACTQVTKPDNETSLVYEWHTLEDLIEAIEKLAHKRIDVFLPAVIRSSDPMRQPGYIGTADHMRGGIMATHNQEPVVEKPRLRLTDLRRMRKQLLETYGEPCARDLILRIHPMLEPDARDLPNFVSEYQYSPTYRKQHKDEIGITERFVVVTDPGLLSGTYEDGIYPYALGEGEYEMIGYAYPQDLDE